MLGNIDVKVGEVVSRNNSLEQFSERVIGYGYDSMAALDLADEKDVIQMTADKSFDMKKTHRPSS